MTVSSHRVMPGAQRSFSLLPAIIAFTFLEALVAAQAISAYHDGFFSVAQMQGRGVSQGLPFTWHFAMWGDLFVISGLSAYLIGRYWQHWPRRALLLALTIGVAAAAIMSWFYTFSALPEAHVQHQRLTTAGVVHLVYMAVALAVFIQFLLFTKDIAVGLLRTVSVLLLLHVFVGTHMLLGLWSLAHPLNWLPVQPLTSVFGWITVGTVMLGLAARNFLRVSHFRAMRNFLLTVTFPIFEFTTGQNPRSAEGYLKFLDFYCGIALASTFYLKKVISLEMKSDQWELPTLLLALIAIKYFLGRISVTQELAIGKSLFPAERVPDDLKLEDRTKITIQVTGFMALYMTLGLFVDQIAVVAGIMTALACGDFRTRDLINENVRKRFADKNFAPRPKEKEYKTIIARRKVAEWYLFSLPHLCKELGVIFGSATAFGIATYGHIAGIDLSIPAYFTLLSVHLINEIITVWWRVDRYVQLKAVNK